MTTAAPTPSAPPSAATPSRLMRWWHWLIAIGCLGLISILVGSCTDGRTVNVTATRNANVATFTTSVGGTTTKHLLAAGDTVTIAGVGAGFDGTFTLTAPPPGGAATTTFTAANPGPKVAAAVGGAGATISTPRDGSWWEAMLLGWCGGLLAWGFVSLLLWWGRDRAGVGLLVCIGFLCSPLWLLCELLWLIFGAIVGRRVRFHASPTSILLLATFVGWYGGTLDGTWGTRTPLSLLAMPLDYTWGLSGSTNGTIFHLVDGPSNHVKPEYATGMSRRGRTDTHQYLNGFALRSTSVTTEGCVETNQLDGNPDLFTHENQHVWQNRAFGPLFTILYVLWFATLAVPGLIAGIAIGDPAGGVNGWSYANNPWETWAYSTGGSPGGDARYLWNDAGGRGAGTAYSATSGVTFALMQLIGWVFVAQAIASGWLRGRLRWWRMLGGGGGLFLLRLSLLAQNLALNALIAIGFAAVSTTLAVITVVAIALQLLAIVEPVAHRRWYQGVLAWSSFLLPTSQLAHLLGLALLVLNALGALVGRLLRLFEGMREADAPSDPPPTTAEWTPRPPRASEAFRILDWPRFEPGSCHLISFGGWVSRLHPNGVNFGMFSFANPTALARPDALQRADRQFFAGLLLSNAAFGHLQAGRFFDAPHPDPRATFWDAIAESRVDAGLRQHAAFAAETSARPRVPQWGPGEGMGLMASRPEFFVGVGILLTLLIVFFAFVAGGWSGAAIDCLTHECFCERARGGNVKQPCNTFSNVVYPLVGLILLWRIRDPARPQPLRNPLLGPTLWSATYGWTLIVLGVAGMIFHASLRRWGDVVDFLGVFLWLGWAIAYDVVRATGRRQRWAFLALWAAVVVPGVVLAAIGETAGRVFVGIALGVAILLDAAVVSFALGGVVRRKRWFAFALATWIVAFVLWILSGGKLTGSPRDIGPLCFPDSPVQVHAIWHLLCAGAAWLYWTYLRSENPPPGGR